MVNLELLTVVNLVRSVVVEMKIVEVKLDLVSVVNKSVVCCELLINVELVKLVVSPAVVEMEIDEAILDPVCDVRVAVCCDATGSEVAVSSVDGEINIVDVKPVTVCIVCKVVKTVVSCEPAIVVDPVRPVVCSEI